MPACMLNAAARSENRRALMLAAGINEETASSRLDACVLITCNRADADAVRLVNEVLPILSRTLGVVEAATKADGAFSAELVIGNAPPRSTAPHIFATVETHNLKISTKRASFGTCAKVHQLKLIVAACYVAGAVIRVAVGQGMSNPPPDEFAIPFDSFVPEGVDLSIPLDLGTAHLAGAGAIGNGFLWAARALQINGVLHIADDDIVSAGNLQRQIWFTQDDVGKSKAFRLAELAQPHISGCLLVPANCRLQDHPDRSEGAWLRKLIVAVDSRRGRRQLQSELPGEVFDASTTDNREIVLHHNRAPNAGACLGCIYARDDREVSHDETVAQHLGVGADDVRTARISHSAAAKILLKHPRLRRENVEGFAYDSLYKELCGSGRLSSTEGSEAQVIAPFAFVSVLAGAALLTELIRQQQMPDACNDWRLNPWMPPVIALRAWRPRRDGCECCGRVELTSASNALWAPT